MPRRWKIALTISFASVIGIVSTLLNPAAASRHLNLTDKISTPAPLTPGRNVKTPAAAAHAAMVSARRLYTVRANDSLSIIAARVYGNAKDWPVLYWANHRTIRWASQISQGQVLVVPPLPARIPAAPKQTAPAVVVAAGGTPVTSGPPASGGGGPFGSPSPAYTACVISRESGGDPTAYNTSSGASGLFGMELAFWDAYGDARDYPNGAYTAPAGAQYAAFYAGYAAQGRQPWISDGC